MFDWLSWICQQELEIVGCCRFKKLSNLLMKFDSWVLKLSNFTCFTLICFLIIRFLFAHLDTYLFFEFLARRISRLTSPCENVPL